MAKTYNTFTNVSTGDVYTAASHNAILQNLAGYRVPPMCQVYRSSDLTSYSSTSAITWNAEAYDTDDMWTSGTGVTINTSGVYAINYYFFISATATLTGNIAYVMVDGVNSSEQHSVVTGGVNSLGSVNVILSLTAGKVITAANSLAGGSSYVVNGAATATNEQSRLSVTWLGQVS